MNGVYSLIALCAGFALDLALGDPHGWPHVVRFCGSVIACAEKTLRPLFPRTKRGERLAGGLLVLIVLAVCVGVPFFLLCALYGFSPIAGCAAESLLCYQLLAARALRDESLPVCEALKNGDLNGARRALSMIVGRDTAVLDETGVIKATVETVAENASDGEVAPLLWLALFGVAGGCFYKAVNTMDSMIAYKNERYRYFGTCAALLDDAVNFIPARLAGLLMVVSAGLCGFDMKNAWRIFLRDRRKHESPNSAHTEAACAGALRVRLAGPAQYEGRIEDKPFLGDDLRPVELEDIRRSHRLLFAASVLAFVLTVACQMAIVIVF